MLEELNDNENLLMKHYIKTRYSKLTLVDNDVLANYTIALLQNAIGPVEKVRLIVCCLDGFFQNPRILIDFATDVVWAFESRAFLIDIDIEQLKQDALLEAILVTKKYFTRDDTRYARYTS